MLVRYIIWPKGKTENTQDLKVMVTDEINSAVLSEQSADESIAESEAEEVEDGCNDSEPYSDGGTVEGEEGASDADESEGASEESTTGREDGEFDDAESDDEQLSATSRSSPNTTVKLLGELSDIFKANPKMTEMVSLTGKLFESALGSDPTG